MKHFSRLLILPVLALGLSACPQSAEQSTEQASSATTETSAAPTAEATVAHSAVVVKGDPTKGPALLASKTCGTCHTVKGVAGAVGTIGPTLDGIATTAATRVAGLDAEAYLRQSIEQPQAFVVPKFQPVMPGMRPNLSDQEYADLIAYLLTLKSQDGHQLSFFFTAGLVNLIRLFLYLINTIKKFMKIIDKIIILKKLAYENKICLIVNLSCYLNSNYKT